MGTLKYASKIKCIVFNSKLQFAIDIWGNTTKHLLNKLEIIHNNAAKCVIGIESTGRTYQQNITKCGWKTITQMYEDSLNNMTHKILNTG